MQKQAYTRVDPVGYPDFTLPVSIIAQIVEKLKVDIVAQTIAELKVDIIAQSLAQLNVNIAAQAITLDVNIAAQAITLNVDIVAQTLTQLNVNIAAQTLAELNVNIAAQTLAALNVNITAQAVTLDINIKGSVVTLTVDQINFRSEYSPYLMGVPVWPNYTIIPRFVADEVDKGLAVAFGTPTIADGLLTLPPSSRVLLKGNIHCGTLYGHEVMWGISPQAGANRSVGFDNPDWMDFIGFWIDGSTVKAVTKSYYKMTVTDITDKWPADAATAYHKYDIRWLPHKVTFYIDGEQVAEHDANIPVSPAGLDWRNNDTITGDMKVKAGWELEQIREPAAEHLVDLIAGKLTTEAYREERRTIRNDNLVAAPSAPPASETGVAWRGKFFPRGCRGHIAGVRVYCKRTGTGTLSLAVSPRPGMGAIKKFTITPGLDWDWAVTWINFPWHYDSLFIWIEECDADVSWGYDTVEPYDAYRSDDSGASWYSRAFRPFILAHIDAQTVGDFPISGIVNAIDIPALAARRVAEAIAIPAWTEKVLASIEGAGELLYLRWHTSHDYVRIRLYCDGNLQEEISGYILNTWGIDKYNPVLPLTEYTAAGSCRGMIITGFTFKNRLEVRAYNATGLEESATVFLFAKVIS